MAIPAVVAAYGQKDNILKTIFYVFVGIAVLYFLWKLFKAIQKLGTLDDAIKEAVGEFVEDAKEGLSNITKPVTPQDTARVITERAQKNPDKPVYVEKIIYDSLKEQGIELPANVKPTVSVPKNKYLEEYEKQKPTVGTYTGVGGLGAWRTALEKTKEEYGKESTIQKAVPRYVPPKEYKDIEAARWEARARKYEEIQKKEEQKKELEIQKRIQPRPVIGGQRVLPINLPLKAI